jgi:hypothetical protein
MAAVGAALGGAAGVGFTAVLRRIVRWEHGTARRELERGLQGMLRSVGQHAGPALPAPDDAATAQSPAPRSLA